MSDLHIVVLAAGQGTRMRSALPKVLHQVAGAPMLTRVLATARALQPSSMTVVVGHQSETVKSAFRDHADLEFVIQEPQLGTGHALLMAEPCLKQAAGTLLLLSGDVPLLSVRTLTNLRDRHLETGAAATVLTAIVDRPQGYGRVVRAGTTIARIVEERDATSDQRAIREINCGIYAFALEGLFAALRTIAIDNAQREYYLPDLVTIYNRGGRHVEAVIAQNADEIRGINSRMDLAEASRIVRQETNAALMASGVTLEDPATTYVDATVQIGRDTVLHPGVALEGRTIIGAGCEIHSGVRIVNSRIGDRVTILDHSVIAEATVADDVSVGPFAHLRKDTHLQKGSKVGNFVEVKRTELGPGSKAMHLSYLGDAIIGQNVNIGAGTITCNYDGTKKTETVIEDGAFIGSDTQLIAPVTVHRDAYVGTGTTVRDDVPAGALAVSAGKQRNIENWVEGKRKKR